MNVAPQTVFSNGHRCKINPYHDSRTALNETQLDPPGIKSSSSVAPSTKAIQSDKKSTRQLNKSLDPVIKWKPIDRKRQPKSRAPTAKITQQVRSNVECSSSPFEKQQPSISSENTESVLSSGDPNGNGNVSLEQETRVPQPIQSVKSDNSHQQQPNLSAKATQSDESPAPNPDNVIFLFAHYLWRALW